MSDGPVLLRGGVVYSPADPFATAMVVDAGVVGWVGSEGAADTAVGPGVRTVHLDGALVTPAFVDAHVHLTDTGLAASSLDLRGVSSADELLDAVAAAARSRPGMPILGHGWDDTAWPSSRNQGPPSREKLDRAARGASVYLSRVDVHSALVSSALVDASPAIRDADGYDPQAALRRSAHHLARRASRDALSAGQRRSLQHAALRSAAARGVGQVHEMAAPHIGGADDLAMLLEWTAGADVPEVVGYWGELGGTDTARRIGARGCAGDLCVDGSIGSRTASLSHPYSDDLGTQGTRYLDADEAAEHVVACTDAGLQAGFHCIGDDAVAEAVEAIRSAAQTRGVAAVQAARHRLEHVEMIDEPLIAELAALGVAASVQPAFDSAWGGPDGMYAQRLGVERASGLNPFAAMARAGVILAFGSDSPVTEIDPWAGVAAAASHRTRRHRITARAAFTAHTRGGWRAAGRDDAGVLVPGAPACYAVWEVPGELVVQAPDDRVAAWSTDPRSGVPGLPDLTPGSASPRCLRTVVHGRTVFDADTPST